MKDEILEYLYNNDTGNILIYMNSFMPFCHTKIKKNSRTHFRTNRKDDLHTFEGQINRIGKNDYKLPESIVRGKITGFGRIYIENLIKQKDLNHW